MSSSVEKRLAAARNQVDLAKTARTRAETQLEAVTARRAEILKALESHGVSSPEEAQARMDEVSAELEEVLDEVERKLA